MTSSSTPPRPATLRHCAPKRYSSSVNAMHHDETLRHPHTSARAQQLIVFGGSQRVGAPSDVKLVTSLSRSPKSHSTYPFKLLMSSREENRVVAEFPNSATTREQRNLKDASRAHDLSASLQDFHVSLRDGDALEQPLCCAALRLPSYVVWTVRVCHVPVPCAARCGGRAGPRGQRLSPFLSSRKPGSIVRLSR